MKFSEFKEKFLWHSWKRECKHYRKCKTCNLIQVYIEDRDLGYPECAWVEHPITARNIDFVARGFHPYGTDCPLKCQGTSN